MLQNGCIDGFYVKMSAEYQPNSTVYYFAYVGVFAIAVLTASWMNVCRHCKLLVRLYVVQ